MCRVIAINIELNGNIRNILTKSLNLIDFARLSIPFTAHFHTKHSNNEVNTHNGNFYCFVRLLERLNGEKSGHLSRSLFEKKAFSELLTRMDCSKYFSQVENQINSEWRCLRRA
jgi:hypothetical protein